MTHELIDELERIDAELYKGPWTARDYGDIFASTGRLILEGPGHGQSGGDATAVATLRSHLPVIIASLQRLAKIEAAAKELDSACLPNSQPGYYDVASPYLDALSAALSPQPSGEGDRQG